MESYYRFFPAPGVEHCSNGAGAVPSDPLAAVVKWVEQGVAPEVLPVITSDGSKTRKLCMYPVVASYNGGDLSAADSCVCKSAGAHVDEILSYTNAITGWKREDL